MMRFDRFTERAQEAAQRAAEIIQRYGHNQIDTEHILLALIEQPGGVIPQILEKLSINSAALVERLDATLRASPKANIFGGGAGQIFITPRVKRIIDLANEEANRLKDEYISTEHIFLAILTERNTPAARILESAGLSRDRVYDAVQGMRGGQRVTDPQAETRYRALEKYSRDLTQLAREGKLDPVIGRDTEILRLIQILSRRTKNNPVLIGEAGVGKTAIVEGLAQKIASNDIPEILSGKRVVALDLGSMIAGSRFRGEFEERLKAVMDEVQRARGEIIMMIDELHTVIGAGAAQGAMDASNMLKPALARGELQCIGATTLDEYHKHIEKDAALERRFAPIYVEEPSVDDTIKMLMGLRDRYEAHHKVHFADEALEAAAHLADRYVTDRHLPDKAIDVIDEAGAAQRILVPSKRKKIISKAEIEDIVAKIARIPPANVSNDDRGKLKTLERDLRNVVFGQDKALDMLASSVKMARSGLGKEDKPIGTFLFSGPTGVGKTESAKQLAYIMGVELIRFDMSEYMEQHAVSRLIGAPPGYVGFDQGGLLTEAITKKPHCVLLLDEIEKAHPAIFNVLLQVMDHGTLTDNNGRKADFRNVIIIMTTNAGAETMAKASIGFTNPREAGDEMADIKRMFTPEFRNRLDAIVSFKALDENVILRVVDKFLLQLEAQLADKKVEVTFTDKLRKHLAKKGFDPLMGARPMQRLIQDTIRRALADELLFGRLVDGGRLKVELDDTDESKTEVLLDIQPLPKKEGRTKPEVQEPATT